jgi:hypothetical protein
MEKKTRYTDMVREHLHYGLSLPERTIRSLAAVAGGTTTLLTDTLLSDSMRETHIYTLTLGSMQQLVIENVAGMESEVAGEETELDDAYVQRRMAGAAIGAAGVASIGFSPIWVLAIAGDAAGGSKVYLNRLVENLKENGLVDEEAECTELVDVLEATQTASRKSATVVSAPPLSREELSQTADELKASYGEAFKGAGDITPELDEIWDDMTQVASRENVSVERLSGMMALDARSRSKKSVDTVVVVGQTGAQLVDEKILDSYRETLTAVSEQGADNYVSDHFQPFLKSAKSHFDSSQTTWTEKKLKGKSEKE